MGELKKAVDSVIYAVSTDTHRQVLTGVLFRYDGQTLTLVATDTHRLSRAAGFSAGGGFQRSMRSFPNVPCGPFGLCPWATTMRSLCALAMDESAWKPVERRLFLNCRPAPIPIGSGCSNRGDEDLERRSRSA